MNERPIKTGIEREGQAYIDVPQYQYHRPRAIADAVAQAIGVKAPQSRRVIVGYERSPLKWVRPR